MQYFLLGLTTFSLILAMPVAATVLSTEAARGFHAAYILVCFGVSFLFYAIWFEGYWEDKSMDILIVLFMVILAGILGYQPYVAGGGT